MKFFFCLLPFLLLHCDSILATRGFDAAKWHITSIRSTYTEFQSPSSNGIRLSIEEGSLILSLSKRTPVSISLFNLLGQVVQTFADTSLESGTHTVNLGQLCLPPGIYFVRLSTSREIIVKKVLLFLRKN